MPFQKGNDHWKNKKKKTASEETTLPVKTLKGPVQKAFTMYREPTGWVVDLLEIQEGQIVKRKQVCPSTLKGEAIEAFKLAFVHEFIFET